jgi:hypothetical protein
MFAACDWRVPVGMLCSCVQTVVHSSNKSSWKGALLYVLHAKALFFFKSAAVSGCHVTNYTTYVLLHSQSNLTKIVVMDSTGSDKARDLARALVSLGYQLSYVMEGGFKAWAAAELPVVEDAVEYDASTGAVIGDELEVIAERANEVVTTVAQPQVRHGLNSAVATMLGCFVVP